MIKALAALAVLLAGCASAGGLEGRATHGISGTDAASLGEGRWFITCSNQMSGCTWRANQVCPVGFDAAEATSAASSSWARTDYQMTVQCKS